MTELVFLSADVPLSKSFALQPDGSYDKTPYPRVANFTSAAEQVTTTLAMYDAIVAHADQGRCLLKGLVTKPLRDESRAGSTNATQPTDWVCLDIDGLDVASPDAFIADHLPAEFHDVSHIVQYSASHGIDSQGLRAHVFFRLARSVAPDTLKLWLKKINLDHFRSQIEPTASFVALRYPLDVTVGQNDKLIYIAPPTCEGFTDPLAGRRIAYVAGARDVVTYNFVTQAAVVESETNRLLNEIRKNHGLPPKKPRSEWEKGEEVILNPDRASITSERHARGFVYVNLNGGDSFAYWYPEDNPEILRSFKGEPAYRLKDLDPGYYARVTMTEEVAPRELGDAVPFAFREIESDTVYNATWFPSTQILDGPWPTTLGGKLDNFFGQHGLDVPDVVEDWEVAFKPNDPRIVDFEGRFCNRFLPSPYMVAAEKQDNLSIPHTINRVLWSICGNDQMVLDHFMNWLAFIVQRREKTMTAWIFHGCPGTGKGFFYENIMRPILGEKYCTLKVLKHLEDKFNSDLEQNILYVLDEVCLNDEKAAGQKLAQLKNLITEQTQSLRAMRANAKQVKNYSNLIFFSNAVDAMTIETGDRRFNVAPRQETPLVLTSLDVEAANGELQAFASYLASYPVDERRARTVLETDAKAKLRHASQSAFDQICNAFRAGDLSLFMQYSKSASGSSVDAAPRYRVLLEQWTRGLGTPATITLADIALVIDAISPKSAAAKLSGHRLTTLLETHGLTMRPDESGTDIVLSVNWKCDEVTKARWLGALTPTPRGNVTPLRQAAS
jgi:hypothetical protein